MSVPERRAMVERPGENLSVRRQCALLNLARSGVYRPGPVAGADDLAMMRRIVGDDLTNDTVWWENNGKMTPAQFARLYQDFIAHSHGKILYAQDLRIPDARLHRARLALPFHPYAVTEAKSERTCDLPSRPHNLLLPDVQG